LRISGNRKDFPNGSLALCPSWLQRLRRFDFCSLSLGCDKNSGSLIQAFHCGLRAAGQIFLTPGKVKSVEGKDDAFI
jgi:hypothetical protein